MNDEATLGTGVAVSGRRHTVFTVGHSTLDLDSFLNLLKKAGVTAVADVRSSPFSRRSPHFNRNELRAALKEIHVKYVFLGKELGGRPCASNLFCDGVADYEKMALEPAFLKGIDRIAEGSTEHTIALMCSEHNPLDCHRCLLVGRVLTERKIPLEHILSNGKLASQHALEEKLLSLVGSETTDIKDLFATRDELLATAYKLRAKAVAYREPSRELTERATQHWSDHAP